MSKSLDLAEENSMYSQYNLSGASFIQNQNVIWCHAYFNQSMQRYRMREETFKSLTQKWRALELWSHYEAIRIFSVLIWNKEPSEYHCQLWSGTGAGSQHGRAVWAKQPLISHCKNEDFERISTAQRKINNLETFRNIPWRGLSCLIWNMVKECTAHETPFIML